MEPEPLSQNKLIEVFGDFHPFLNIDGMPSRGWEESILTRINLPSSLPLAWNHTIKVRQIACHKKIAPFLKQALGALLLDQSEVWNTINDYGGAYAFRLQRNSANKLSSHCWGVAIDLDVGDNPFGKTPQVHPRVVEIFRACGFLWGGHFKGYRQDGMHFEFYDIGRLT